MNINLIIIIYIYKYYNLHIVEISRFCFRNLLVEGVKLLKLWGLKYRLVALEILRTYQPWLLSFAFQLPRTSLDKL